MTQYRHELERQARTFELYTLTSMKPRPYHTNPDRDFDWMGWLHAFAVVVFILVVLQIIWGE